MNLDKWLYSNPQEQAEGGEGGAAGGGQSGGGAGGEGGQQQTTTTGGGIDYDKLAAAIAKANGQQQQTKPKDDYQEHLNSEKQKEEQKANQAKIEGAVKFNSSFADVLTKNKGMFPERTANLLTRQFESETDKADTLQKFAARDFFSMKGNLELLSPAERLQVEQKLTNEHGDISMTSGEAWQMVERALYISEMKQDADKRNNAYGKNEKEMPENIQKFHERIYPKGVVSLGN